MLSLRVFLTVFLREFWLILWYHFWMNVKSRPFDFLAASDNTVFDENIFWHYLVSFAFFKFHHKSFKIVWKDHATACRYETKWIQLSYISKKCMKKNVGIALQKIFQPIIVAYLHHHGLFGCHDCRQIPLHAVHQRDPKQGKIKRSVVYRRPKYSAEAKGFHYSAFCFGRWNFIPNIRPSVFS